jgi:hypothetical protein
MEKWFCECGKRCIHEKLAKEMFNKEMIVRKDQRKRKICTRRSRNEIH